MLCSVGDAASLIVSVTFQTGTSQITPPPFLPNPWVWFGVRWACLLKQQTSITVDRLPTKEYNLPFSFAENRRKHAVSVHIYIYICCFKQKMEVQTIFLNTLTVCSSCKRNFFVCPFVYKETNGSYPFANGLNGLKELAHLLVWLTLACPGHILL
jgi:hypothetical protein